MQHPAILIGIGWESGCIDLCDMAPIPICDTAMLADLSWMYGYCSSRSQWSRGLRRGTAAARLLGLWVRNPPVVWMSLISECCMLSGSFLSATGSSLVHRSPTERVCVCMCV